jgi:diketogulonate reductase-like aldo/keto reductase
VFPLVGGRKVEHLKQNIQALDISLSPEQMHRIDNAKPLDIGFPYIIIVSTSYERYESLVFALLNTLIGE